MCASHAELLHVSFECRILSTLQFIVNARIENDLSLGMDIVIVIRKVSFPF